MIELQKLKISTSEINARLINKYAGLLRLEREILKFPQIELPIDHSFCNGLYARTISIPAGTLVMGAVHRDECFFLVRYGQLVVTTDENLMVVSAGDMLTSRSESKRAGVAVSDAIVTTFHSNTINERQPERLWEMLVIDLITNAIEIEEKEQEVIP